MKPHILLLYFFLVAAISSSRLQKLYGNELVPLKWKKGDIDQSPLTSVLSLSKPMESSVYTETQLIKKDNLNMSYPTDIMSSSSSCSITPHKPQKTHSNSLAFGNPPKSEHYKKISNELTHEMLTENHPSPFGSITAKIIYTAGGLALIGVAGSRFISRYIKNRELESFTRPPTPFTDLFGHILLKNQQGGNKTVKVATGDVLSNDTVVALLFTGQSVEDLIQQNGFASFLPKLKDIYTECNIKGQKLEIVYIPLDKTSQQSKTHFENMPWYGLPFEDWDRKRDLIARYDLKKLPSIVLLNGNGSILNTKAYNAMIFAPNEYPWYPQNVSKLIERGLINNKNQTVDTTSLSGKKIGLYFSGSWCAPCQKFTPKLVELYNKLQQQPEKPFEIIFVSNDENYNKFSEYFKQMPWLAIPYNDTSARALIQDELEVKNLPSLILLDENFELLNKDGRRSIEQDLQGDLYPWYPQIVKDISQTVDGLLEYPSLIVFMEEADNSTQSSIIKHLEGVHEQEKDKLKVNNMQFFTVSKSNTQSLGMRRLFKLPMLLQSGDMISNKKPQKLHLVILDLPQKCYYKKSFNATDVETLQNFLNDFNSGQLHTIKEVIESPPGTQYKQ